MYAQDDFDYIFGRLVGTIVRVKGVKRLFEVVDILERDEDETLSALGRYTLNGKMRVEDVDNLLLSSPPLGYADVGKHCVFVSRVPMREDWRQGLRRQNISATYQGHEIGVGDKLLKILYQPIFGTYKGFNYAMDIVRKGEHHDCSLSRNFCLDREYMLWYKGKIVVGSVGKNGPELNDEFLWLKETLNDEVD